MAKRGPKPYCPDSDKVMPVRVIARRLGVSVRTANYDLRRGLNRLKFAYALWLLHRSDAPFTEVQ